MKIRIGIIGLGTVGSGVLELLDRHRQFFKNSLGFEFELNGLASRSQARLDRFQGLAPLMTTDPLELASHPSMDVILELAGGEDRPKSWVETAFAHRKHVITANKALLAKHGKDLFPLAEKNGCFLLFEAAVGGGIPIIRTLQESFIANDIHGLACIINGTCNYILSEMSGKKLSFLNALKAAQELGYAEADPSFDIEGTDSAHKVALLASLCYGKYVDYANMNVEGITTISALDILMAEEMGFVIKLLGIVSQDKLGRIQADVYPVLLEKKHQLATVNGVLNAVFLKTSAVGPILLTGSGAGKLPTASSVLSDLVSLSRQLATGNPRIQSIGFFSERNRAELLPIDDLETEFYLRLTTVDKPGVLAQVTAILGEEGISIRALMQKPEHDPDKVPVIFLTHSTRNANISKALLRIDALEIIRARTQVLRFYH
ncbi:MAG TPA: homoserine dehydrogenase [Fibrobacteria bacterium]|nr:homoserine dehydrogenase [Fibrobacteria bacterium]